MPDENQITSILANKDSRYAVAFAASCASRLIENHARFAEKTRIGGASALHEALTFAWSVADGNLVGCGARAREYLQRCEGLVPDTEAFAGCGVSGALDAVCAVLELLDCIAAIDAVGLAASGHAAEAARCAADTADMIDERRKDRVVLSVAHAESGRQVELLAWIAEGRDANQVVARAKELGRTRDLIDDG